MDPLFFLFLFIIIFGWDWGYMFGLCTAQAFCLQFASLEARSSTAPHDIQDDLWSGGWQKLKTFETISWPFPINSLFHHLLKGHYKAKKAIMCIIQLVPLMLWLLCLPFVRMPPVLEPTEARGLIFCIKKIGFAFHWAGCSKSIFGLRAVTE